MPEIESIKVSTKIKQQIHFKLLDRGTNKNTFLNKKNLSLILHKTLSPRFLLGGGVGRGGCMIARSNLAYWILESIGLLTFFGTLYEDFLENNTRQIKQDEIETWIEKEKKKKEIKND